jgi:8-oxo-dGTP diphosphatase
MNPDAGPDARGGRAVTAVAVGVLTRADGQVLLADRPAGKPYAGYWEFPGGKIEAGETVAQALARELHEELGVTIGAVHPWLVREFDYPHAYVRLHFCRVFDWRGAPAAREGQRLRFCQPAPLRDAPADRPMPMPMPAPLLPAAVAVMRWLGLPAQALWLDLRDAGPAQWVAGVHALERPAAAPRLVLLALPRPDRVDGPAHRALLDACHRIRAAGDLLLTLEGPAQRTAAALPGGWRAVPPDVPPEVPPDVQPEVPPDMPPVAQPAAKSEVHLRAQPDGSPQAWPSDGVIVDTPAQAAAARAAGVAWIGIRLPGADALSPRWCADADFAVRAPAASMPGASAADRTGPRAALPVPLFVASAVSRHLDGANPPGGLLLEQYAR